MVKIENRLHPLTAAIPQVTVYNDFWGRMVAALDGDKMPLANFYRTIVDRAFGEIKLNAQFLASAKSSALSLTLKRLKICKSDFKAERTKVENSFFYKYIAPLLIFFKNWKRAQWTDIEKNYKEAKKKLTELKREIETVEGIQASFDRLDWDVKTAENSIRNHTPQFGDIEKLQKGRKQITDLVANYNVKDAPHIGEKAAASFNAQRQRLTARIASDLQLIRQESNMQAVLGPDQLNIEAIRLEYSSLLGGHPLNISDAQSLQADLLQRIQGGRITEKERREGLDALYSGIWGEDNSAGENNSRADRLITRMENRASDLRNFQQEFKALIGQLNSKEDPEGLLEALKRNLRLIENSLDQEIQNHDLELENLHQHLWMLPSGVRFDPDQRTLTSSIRYGQRHDAPWKVLYRVLEPAQKYVREHQASKDPSEILALKWTQKLIGMLEKALAEVNRFYDISVPQKAMDELLKLERHP